MIKGLFIVSNTTKTQPHNINDDTDNSDGDNDILKKYIDVVHEQIIRTPSTISNLSLLLNNVDFVASPGVIYKSNTKSESTLSDSELRSPIPHFQEGYDFEASNQTSDSDKLKVSDFDNTLQPITDDLVSSTQFETASQSLSEITQEERYVDTDVTLTPSGDNVDNITTSILTTQNPTISTEELIIIPSTSEANLTRKRLRKENEWIDNKAKRAKNLGQAYVGCRSKKSHVSKTVGPSCNCRLKCGENIPYERRNAILQKFYQLGDHSLQWQYVVKYTLVEKIKKMQLDRKNNRCQTITYYLPQDDSKLKVCKRFFLSTLRISD